MAKVRRCASSLKTSFLSAISKRLDLTTFNHFRASKRSYKQGRVVYQSTTKQPMLLCYMPIEEEGKVTNELALVPDKPDLLSRPVPIRSLFPTRAAVFRIGAEEALTIASESTNRQLILSALEPALIYLTPNLSQFPGFAAKHVKITISENSQIQTYHSRDRNHWDEWVANKVRV